MSIYDAEIRIRSHSEKDLNSTLRVGDYGPLRLFDRTVITRLMAISEVIIPPTSSSP